MALRKSERFSIAAIDFPEITRILPSSSMETVKICHRCKLSKNLSGFQRDSHKPDGYRASCKACVNARRVERRKQARRASGKECEPRIGKPPIASLKSNAGQGDPIVGKIMDLENILRNRGATLRYHDHLKYFSLSVAQPHIMLEEKSLDQIIEKAKSHRQ